MDGCIRQPTWKWNTRFGTWNIKIINGKEVELVEEMEKYKLKVLELSEIKRRGKGIVQLDKGHVLRYSGIIGGRRVKEGVGVILSEEMEKRVTAWEPVSSRLMTIRLELEMKMFQLMMQTYWKRKNSMYNYKEHWKENMKRAGKF
jgi:hypothetical protein